MQQQQQYQQQQQQHVEHGRQPCPDRIIDDIGGAFGMGAVGGGIFHAVKGFINSPSGYKLSGTALAIRSESPRLGGSFAIWGALFSTFDCTCMYLRGKEDPYNAIAAGALTGGFLQLRAGPRTALKAAVFGGFLLALIEGMGIALQKVTAPPPPGAGIPGMPGMPGQPMPAGPMGGAPPPGFESSVPDAGESSGGLWSWFGFGGDSKPEESKTSVYTEDFSAPPPMPDFKSEDFKDFK